MISFYRESVKMFVFVYSIQCTFWCTKKRYILFLSVVIIPIIDSLSPNAFPMLACVSPFSNRFIIPSLVWIMIVSSSLMHCPHLLHVYSLMRWLGGFAFCFKKSRALTHTQETVNVNNKMVGVERMKSLSLLRVQAEEPLKMRDRSRCA